MNLTRPPKTPVLEKHKVKGRLHQRKITPRVNFEIRLSAEFQNFQIFPIPNFLKVAVTFKDKQQLDLPLAAWVTCAWAQTS